MVNFKYKKSDYNPRSGHSKPVPPSHFSLGQLRRVVGKGLIVVLVTGGLLWAGGWWLQGQLTHLWPIQDPVTLVVADPNPGATAGPWVVQLQPESHTVVWLSFPADQTTELFNGYGQYKLPAVFPLLTLDHRSPAYIRAAFSAISQSLVTEIVPWPELTSWQSRVLAAGLPPKNTVELGQMPFHYLTNMYWKKIWSANLKWSERVQNFKAWKLAWQWRWFTEQTQLQWVWTTDRKALLGTAGSTASQCPIAVVNTTEIKGLARQISTVLAVNGYSIVRTTVDPQLKPDSHIWLDPTLTKTCLSVAEKVSGILPSAPKPEENDQITKQYRAPIVIMVGAN